MAPASPFSGISEHSIDIHVRRTTKRPSYNNAKSSLREARRYAGSGQGHRHGDEAGRPQPHAGAE